MVEQEIFSQIKPVRLPIVQCYSDETLAAFCKSIEFLAPMHLFKGFQEDNHRAMAQDTMDHINYHQASLFLEANANARVASSNCEQC